MTVPRSEEALLRQEVTRLGRALGTVIQEQAGAELHRLVEDLRESASRLRRRPDSAGEARLVRRIRALPHERLVALARSLTLFSMLVNICEARHEVRRRRDQGAGPLAELLGRLQTRGVPRAAVDTALEGLSASVVLTAHPTDAIRWTVHEILARVESELDLPRPAGDEALLRSLTALWQTSFARHRRPTPVDEVRHVIHRLETVLLTALPQVAGRLSRAYRAVHGDEPTLPHEVLRLGSWIGGDRDGNPHVTSEVTTDALDLYRRSVLDAYRRTVPLLMNELVSSTRLVPVSSELAQKVSERIEADPAVRERVEGRSSAEVYRLALNAMAVRLERSLEECDTQAAPGSLGGYPDADALHAELDCLRRSLCENQGERLADGALGDWIRAVEAFGFGFVSLDIRQHRQRHRRALDELLGRTPAPAGTASDETDALERLLALPDPEAPPDATLTPDSLEVVRTLRGLSQQRERLDPAAIGDLVISHVDDHCAVLELLALTRRTGLVERRADGTSTSHVNLVPLFESVEGLRTSAASMERLYRSPAYREQLRARGMRQQIMLGYSDSAKDGGYLAACWALWCAQRELADQARQEGISIEFFHGRGGSIGRGGGPTHRAILAQPPGTVQGRIKLTEQGEVIASKYGSVPSAVFHLERLVAATLEASLDPEQRGVSDRLPKRWADAMGALADRSRETYRKLVHDDPCFLDFFHAATPIDEIAGLQIGSRPARRKATASVDDLRAIPWNFAWNQSRMLLSSWYGAGTALAELEHDGPGGLRLLYRRWPFFRSVVDNLEQVLAKVEMRVARRYAALARDVPGARRIFARVVDEYSLAVRGVRTATGSRRLLANDPELRASLALRSPLIDTLGYVQAELLHRKRESASAGPEADTDRERIEQALKLAINGVAAGLRNTG